METEPRNSEPSVPAVGSFGFSSAARFRVCISYFYYSANINCKLRLFLLVRTMTEHVFRLAEDTPALLRGSKRIAADKGFFTDVKE